MHNIIFKFILVLLLTIYASTAFTYTETQWHNDIAELEKSHPGKSGIYILEKGEDALISRAWLVDNAKHTIDIQYFIWSTDNIGTLAAAALLRAADRGVRIRVIVDDLLIDATNDTLYALAIHPKVTIKIYNPNINIGTNIFEKMFNATVNFKEINQRMHNKVAIFDEQAVITGGRNMADEYYDFDHEYNFKDRDVLFIGEAVKSATSSFSDYWQSEYVTPIEELINNPHQHDIESVSIDDWGEENQQDASVLKQQLDTITKTKAQEVYQQLKAYEEDNVNFIPSMRKKISDIDKYFSQIIAQIDWVDAEFISDLPGKNNSFTLRGGGKLTSELEHIVKSAKQRIVIQSPYLVMSWDAWKLLRKAVKRGVDVRIVTNSLSSTDNLAAYSGYARQRNRLLNSGIEIYEFKPDAKIRADIINRYDEIKDNPPIFAIHAKSMVIDGEVAYIGSFNFDPRSENLNTEVGIFIEDSKLASELEAAIENDMLPENSWNVKLDGHSHDTSFYKRSKVFFLKLIPMDAIL